MDDQKTTEPAPIPESVASADQDLDAKLKAWGDQLQGQDLAEASHSLAAQARAEAELGKWVAGPNELQRLASLEKGLRKLTDDVRSLRTGEARARVAELERAVQQAAHAYRP